MGPVEREITERLRTGLTPVGLSVVNDSANHHGHAGDDGSGESHFSVRIVAAAFNGLSRLDRQRLVNRTLGDLPGNRVHAMAIQALTPLEAQVADAPGRAGE